MSNLDIITCINFGHYKHCVKCSHLVNTKCPYYDCKKTRLEKLLTLYEALKQETTNN